MKVYKKSDLREKNQENNTKSERNLMTQINFPFIVGVKFAFQTESKLFLVQEFIQGGDLFFHIHSGQKFSAQKTKFYIVEITLALEFLHKNNMIYRDLKPENILVDSKGHIKLTDFGLSKIVQNRDEKSYTICGTMQYLAPEIIGGEGYDESVDWWSLGIIMFEMLTGKLPFKFRFDTEPNLNIYKKKVVYPSWMEENAKDLIINLLNVDPDKRLGNGKNGAENIKRHLAESPIFSDSSTDLMFKAEENEEEEDYDGFTFVAKSYKELKDMEKAEL